MKEHTGDEAGAGNGVDQGALSIECRRDGAAGEVVLAGALDLVGGDALETAVTALLAEGVEDVAVRADRVGFVDSSGLGGLLAARAMVVGSGGAFHFGPMSGNVARVVDLAGVSDLLGQAPFSPER